MVRTLLVAALVVAYGAPARAQSPSEDSAIGVWPWLVGNINSSIPSIINQAVASRQDCIYIHLWRTTGVGAGTLHMADEAGTWNPAWGALDPDVNLRSLIAQAHAAHLQVVGVVNCFLSGGPLPGHVGHESLLLSVLDYLVNTVDAQGDPVYALDGIALDRVRFYDGTSNPHALVSAFVQSVRGVIGLTPLHAFIAANLYHIEGPPYNGTFRTYSESMSLLQGQYGQHWENLSPLLDVFLPMAYVAEGGLYGSNTVWMEAYVNRAAAFARQAAANAGVPTLRVLPAIRAWNDTSGTTTPASLDACIRGALNGGGQGTMVFRYFTALGQTSWWNTIGQWSGPGSHLPLAAVAASGQGPLINLNASGSSSQVAPATLQYRWDFDDDGQADTPFSGSPLTTFQAPGPGTYRVTVQVRDAAGRIAARKKEVTSVGTGLAWTITPTWMSTGAGSSNVLSLSAGAQAQGQFYVIAGSASGTIPGTPLAPNLLVPLNWDWFTDITLAPPFAAWFPGFSGALDVSGSAQATISFPAGLVPSSLWLHSLFFAAVGIDDPVTPEPTFVTGAATLLILP